MEFYTGTLPNLAASGARPTLVIVDDNGNDYLGASFRMANGLSGLTFVLEYSEDLGATPWIEETGAVLVSSVDNGDGTSTLTYRLSTPYVNPINRQFLRVKYNYSE